MNKAAFTSRELLIVSIVLPLTIFMLVLDLTVANVCLPYISGDLASTPEQSTNVITSFAIGVALSISIGGWLAKNFGQYITFIVALLFFTLFSFLCGISTSMEELILFRFFQGFAAGPMFPLGNSYFTQIHPKERVHIMMGIFSIVVLVAPVLGPIIGGYFCVYFTWHWAFLVNVPTGIFCLFILGVLLRKVPSSKEKARLDYVSFILLCIGVITLQLMLNRGEQWNWFLSVKTNTLAIIAGVAFVYFFLWNLHYKRSLFDLGLLKRPTYFLSMLVLIFLYGQYMGFIVIFPLWLQTQMGYTALIAGLAVAPFGLFPVLLGYVISRFLAKGFHLHFVLASTIVIFFVNLYVMQFTPQVGFYQIFFSRLLYGIGVALWIVPLFGLAALELQAKEMASAMSMFHFARSLISGIVTSLVTALYMRRMVLHHSHMVDKINLFNPEAVSFLRVMSSYSLSLEQSREVLGLEISKQASVLSLIDVCYLMNWLTVIIAFLGVLLWKKCNIRYTCLKKAVNYDHN